MTCAMIGRCNDFSTSKISKGRRANRKSLDSINEQTLLHLLYLSLFYVPEAKITMHRIRQV